MKYSYNDSCNASYNYISIYSGNGIYSIVFTRTARTVELRTVELQLVSVPGCKLTLGSPDQPCPAAGGARAPSSRAVDWVEVQ